MTVAVTVLVASVVASIALLALGRRVAFVAFLAVVLVTQNLFTMLALRSGLVDVAIGESLLLAKELVLVAGLGAAALSVFAHGVLTGRLRASRADWIALTFLLFLVVPFLSSSVGLVGRLSGLRQLALLPALYLLGRWIGFDVRDVAALPRLIVGIALALASFGLVEAYLLPQDFWLRVGHEEYYLMKRGRPIQDALYTNMRFWVSWSDEPIRRVASLTGDPLVSSYPMVLALSLIAARTLRRRRIRLTLLLASVVIASALVMTLSRGGVLVLLLGIGFLAIARTPRRLAVVTSATIVAAVAIALGLGDAVLQVTYGEGHIEQLRAGLVRGIEHPFGLGTGTAGSVASGRIRAAGETGTLLGGGDSFFGSTATQAGLVGLVLLVGTMLAMIIDLMAWSRWLQRRDAPYAWLYDGFAVYLAALLATSVVNESGYGYVASGLAFLIAGGLSRHAGELRRAADESRPGQPRRSPAVGASGT